MYASPSFSNRLPGDAGAMSAAPGSAPLGISLRRLNKRFGTHVALDDVSLQVQPGEFLTLLGPSGSGKTTLLNVIAGFQRPDRGAIFFGEQDVTLTPVHERGLGIVFQSYALFSHMTVGQNVGFPLRVRGIAKSEAVRRVGAALEMVGLASFADRRIGTLSGGQRQRVALARAIVFGPRIVLMDEPLSALDKNLRERMQVEIRQLQRQVGATTLYVTHDQREALTMSDRIAVMNAGRIVQCDTPQQLYERPNSTFVASFIGETTLLPLRRSGAGVAIGDGPMLAGTAPPMEAGPAWLAVRAERVLLPWECGEDTNRIPVVVQDTLYQGDSLLVLVATADGTTFSIRRPPGDDLAARMPRPGDRMEVGLAPQNTLVLTDQERP